MLRTSAVGRNRTPRRQSEPHRPLPFDLWRFWPTSSRLWRSTAQLLAPRHRPVEQGGPMNLTQQGLGVLASSPIADHPYAHAHFWERALSRRNFLAAAGLAGGAA